METINRIFHVRIVNDIVFTWTVNKLREYLAAYNKFTIVPNIVNPMLETKGIRTILNELPNFGSYDTDYLELIFHCKVKSNGDLDVRWEYKKSEKMYADVLYPGIFIGEFKQTFPIKSKSSIKIVDSTEKTDQTFLQEYFEITQQKKEKPCGKCVYPKGYGGCISCFRSNNYKEFKKRQDLNLCQLLKDSIGETFYMPHFGNVVLQHIYSPRDEASPVQVSFSTMRGMLIDLISSGISSTGNELCVFPSKENRDWSTYVPSKPKVEPKWIPQQGDAVWVRDNSDSVWLARYYSHKGNEKFYVFDNQRDYGNTTPWRYCIPIDKRPW